MMKKLRKTIFNKKKTGSNGQNILLYSGYGMVVIGFFAIIFFFFWPPVFFEKLVENQTLKDASLIITPLTGILSAFIIFLSFVFQQRSTTKQLELQRLEKEMEFVYYRLSELQSYSQNNKYKDHLIDIGDLIINIPKRQAFDDYNDNKIKEMIMIKKEALSFLVKYFNIFIILKIKLNQIDKSFKLDANQKEYIESALNYEYHIMVETHLPTIGTFNFESYIRNGIVDESSNFDKIKPLYNKVKSLISK